MILNFKKAQLKKEARTANPGDQSAVQSKIIDLLSTGKITPQECAELLAAIYKPKAAQNADDPAAPKPGIPIPPESPALMGERNE